MSSPSRNKSNSPIRNLQDRSPHKLDIIREQQEHQNKMRRIDLLSRDVSYDSLIAGSRRRAELAAISNYSSVYENQSLRRHENQSFRREIAAKDSEIQTLNRELALANQRHLKNQQQLILQNQALKREIALLSRQNFEDIDELKEKYLSQAAEDSQLFKRNYIDDMRRLLNDLETSKDLLTQKEKELEHMNMMNHRNSQQYDQNLERLISENNLLRNEIKYCEINRDNEVRNADTKKELQKSRTKGIISFCKETNQFIEKEVAKLAEQLLEKNISIESFTKQLMKQRQHQENLERQAQNQISRLKDDHINEIRQKEQAFSKVEKHFKEQIVELKARELELLDKIGTMQHEADTRNRQQQHLRGQLNHRELQIEELKVNLNRLHDDHAQQISKVMSDSRIKRRSMKNISSEVSSLKDLSYAELAGGLRSSLQKKESIGGGLQAHDSSPLPTVREQLAQSAVMAGTYEEEDFELKQLILHYELMLEELKRNKIVELSMANETIAKLKSNLQEKQQQVLDVLSRFSPLMEFKMNQPSLEQERQNKIKQHYKADIDILSVMLDKYQIEALRKYK